MTSARYGPHGVGSLQPTSQADSLIYSTCQLLKGLMSIGIGVGTGGGGSAGGHPYFFGEGNVAGAPLFRRCK